MTTRGAGQRFRQRKLSVKQNLAILRENELAETLDEEALRHLPKFETGVEKGEESEHHLQAVISAAATGAKQAYIPTPPTNVSTLHYERLYRPRFQQPQTYIRSSSTVEDSIGCLYCISSEDEVFLKQFNAKKSKAKQCSEEQFEEVMNFFEQTAELKQPFRTVDNAPVLPYEDMEASFDETIEETSRVFAKDIYQHWKSLRVTNANHPLMPQLKTVNLDRGETDNQDDPYICFRRREVRVARKTRGRDAQITEKLKKLRQEMELARQLMHTVKQREYLRRDQIAMDRAIFEKRSAVKDAKRNLGIKDDDEDLINQKPVIRARPKPEGAVIQRGAAGMVPRLAQDRLDARAPDSAQLPQLEEQRKRRNEEIENMIQDNINKHRVWNNDWVDQTWRPITPPLDSANQSSFRTAITEFLPTPPASVSEESGDGISMAEKTPRLEGADKEKSMIRYASPPAESIPRPSYRKRYGRGGRLFVDRRGLKRPRTDDLHSPDADDTGKAERMQERMQYDLDSDDDATPVYANDFWDEWNIRYRIAFAGAGINQHTAAQQQRLIEEARRQQQAAASANAAINGPAAAGARAALPAARAAS